MLSFVILLIPIPTVQSYGPLVLLVAIVAAVLDTVIFARSIGQKVRAKFPKGDSSDLSTKGSGVGFLRVQPGVPVPPLAGAAAARRGRHQDRLSE